MTNTSPIFFLQPLLEAATRLRPPAWLVDEGQQRLLLLLNHILMQEPEAQARLARKKGHVVHVHWGVFFLPVCITPAGLTDQAAPERTPDLVLSLDGQPPWEVAGQIVAGHKPAVQIEGDVQLAAELAWLVDNLRWDVEEDLARVLGDVAAHSLTEACQKLLGAIRSALKAAPSPVNARAGT
jgi:ubiquinone biosynthesis protein UbiJ